MEETLVARRLATEYLPLKHPSVLGLVVRNWRKDNGYTIAKLAREATLSRATLRRLERGDTRTLQRQQLGCLAHVLRVDHTVLRELGMRQSGPTSCEAQRKLAEVAWIPYSSLDNQLDVQPCSERELIATLLQDLRTMEGWQVVKMTLILLSRLYSRLQLSIERVARDSDGAVIQKQMRAAAALSETCVQLAGQATYATFQGIERLLNELNEALRESPVGSETRPEGVKPNSGL